MAKIHEHLGNRKRVTPHPTSEVERASEISEPVFKGRLRAHFFVRFHMLLIFSLMILSGVSVSKLLLEFGVRSMPIRYAIAVGVAYGVFFLLVRLWLWYIGIAGTKARQRQHSSSDRSSGGSSSSPDINIDFPSGGGKGSSWGGFGGGKSGGGGASDSWGQPAFLASDQSYSSGGSGSGWFSGGSSKSSFGLGDLNLDGGDDGCLGVIVLLLLAALLFAIFGAGIYAVYQAPTILAEAAFQAALASGLIRAAKQMERGDWAGSVFKKTIIPLVIILALAVAFGWAAQRYCPAATKLAEVFRACR